MTFPNWLFCCNGNNLKQAWKFVADQTSFQSHRCECHPAKEHEKHVIARSAFDS